MKNTIPANYRYTDWDKMELDINLYTDKLLQEDEYLSISSAEYQDYLDGMYTTFDENNEEIADIIFTITVSGDYFKATIEGEVDAVVEHTLYEFCDKLLEALRRF